MEAAIRNDLTHVDIDLYELDPQTSRGPGVLCFSEFGEPMLSIVRKISRHGCHVLALAAGPLVLNRGDDWCLLRAGASEVMSWKTDRAFADQINARLKRWTAIDQFTDSPLVCESLVGVSATWRTLVRGVVEAARFTRAPVLLMGESGTGKELLARLVHQLDDRVSGQRSSGRDLVTVDCTTLEPELSGSELFGHEKGAFTGAINSREGAFALADGATLFLDEVGELPIRLQTRLLRAVQEKTYKRVGGNVWQNTDFRLVCATNRDLPEAVERGEFRIDLYYRIASWVFHTPPLRERPEDILPLATHFLKTFWRGETALEFDLPVREYLQQRLYPGNVRDLCQLVQRIAQRHVGQGAVTIGDIPQDDRPLRGEPSFTWPDENLEKTLLQAITLGVGLKEISQATVETAIRIAVESEQGNLQRAAKRLGVTDRALQMRRASGTLTP